MNWIKYDRLISHLETMNPAEFNYKLFKEPDGPGCIACQCQKIARAEGVHLPSGSAAIALYLSIDDLVAAYLFGWHDDADPFQRIATGPEGIKNALHRLRTVAAKYPRPAVVEPLAAFVADDAAFLAACRAMAQQPLEVEPAC